MTATNRAFISAYRQDAAESPWGSFVAHSASRPAGLQPSVEIVAAAASGSRRPGEPAHRAALLGSTIDVVPPPADPPVALPPPPASRRRPERALPLGYPPPARRADPAAGVKRPLSEFMPRAGEIRRSSVPSDVPTAPGSFRVGTTVASLRWPPVCHSLLRQSGEQFDILVDSVLPQSTGTSRLLGVLGLFPGVGCSTTALCLAARAALRGRRTVLVEGNFFRPRFGRWLDVMPTVGWHDVLDGAAPLADAMIRTVDERFDLLILSAERLDDPLALVAGAPTSATAAILRQHYDVVLVDLGGYFEPRSQPVALELVRQLNVDAALLVAQPEEADPRDLNTVAARLAPLGCEVAGIVENRTARPTPPQDDSLYTTP